MPSTRSSLALTHSAASPEQSRSHSLDEIPSDRSRKDVEHLCKKWNVSDAELLAFFGPDCLTPKLVATLRDLRVRVEWPTAKLLLEQVAAGRRQDASPRTPAGRSETRRRSISLRSGPSRSWTWLPANIKAAIALADAQHPNPKSHMRTRSGRVSAVYSPPTTNDEDGGANSINGDASETSDVDMAEPATPQLPADATDASPDLSSRPPDREDAERGVEADDEAEAEAGGQDEHDEHAPSPQSSPTPRLKRSADHVEPELPAPKRAAHHATKLARRRRKYPGLRRSAERSSSIPPEAGDDDDIPVEIPDSDHEQSNDVKGAACKVGTRDSWPQSFCRTLEPEEWLNDEAIHGILSILAASSAEGPGGNGVIEPLLVTSSSSSPARSIKKMLSESKPSTVILPVHLRNHWTLMILRLQSRRAELYDSMPGKDNRAKATKIFFQFASAYLESHPNTWCHTDVPCAEQANGYDCGVHTLINAAYVLAGKPTPTSVSADLWRKAFYLLANPEAVVERPFADIVDLPAPENHGVPVIERTSEDDIAAFHEHRKAWAAHFVGKVAQLANRISEARGLAEVQEILACLVRKPAEDEAPRAALTDLQHSLRNYERQLELRTALSQLPGCETEGDKLSPLRETVSRLKWELSETRSRKEAQGHLSRIVEFLEQQRRENEEPLARLKERLATYRELHTFTAPEDA